MGGEEGRRSLFVSDMFEGIGSAFDSFWAWGGLAFIFGGVLGVLLMAAIAGSTQFGHQRRALEGSSPTPTNFAFSSNTILTECAQGVDSFLCDLPVNELLQVFSTGMCASVGGLLCVVSQDDLLALLPTAGGN